MGTEQAREPIGAVLDQFQDPGGAVSPRGQALGWVLGALAGALAVAAVVWVGLYLVHTSGSDGVAEAEQRYHEAVNELHEATTSLQDAIDNAQSAVDRSAGQVADEQIRQDFSLQIADAQQLVHASQDVKPTSGFTAASNVDDAAVEVFQLSTRVSQAELDLAASQRKLAQAQQQYQLVQAQAAQQQAGDDLAAAITAGETAYASSAGRVLDDAVRQTLRARLDGVPLVKGASTGGDVTAVQAATQRFIEARGAIESATQDVTAAQRAWQAEQDRLAQEKVEAETQRAQAEWQNQLAWLRQQPPAGNDPSLGGPWWRFQDQNGNIWCMLADGTVWRC